MARQDFDEAIKALDDALAVEDATRLDEARLALLQARQGKADALLDAVAAAVDRRDAARARQTLKDYLASPYATRRPRATLLLHELDRATDDESATKLLARLTDERLAAFAATGRLADGEPFTDEGMRQVYHDTLRRHLPEEQAARAAVRAEEERRRRAQAEREERLRAGPLFVALTAFAADVRRQAADEARQRAREERALELFLRDTNTNDPAARDRARQALRAGREAPDHALAVLRKKAQVKKDFRQAPDHDPADLETFDRLVDEELDRLLADLKGGARP
jgi:hypothetical protein